MNLTLKKSILFSAIIIFITCISSCRTKSVTPNNPDVDSRIIDSVSVAPSGGGRQDKAVDADQDGTTDFYLVAINDDDAFSTSLDAQQVLDDVNLSTDGVGMAADYGESAIIDSVSVPKGPGPPRAIWANFGTCSSVDGVIVEGFAGAGDIYIGFYITKPDGKHYGWLKLNIASDGKSIKLKSVGYHRKPRTAIIAGEV